jgi:hypothetical protein
MRRLTLAFGLVAAVTPAPAAGRTRVVATLAGAGAAISAWNGHAVLSQLNPSTGRWSLMHATAHGVAALPVAPQNRPFDADVGTDAAGRPVAVFSRCPRRGPIVSSYAQLPGTSRCRISVIRLDAPGAAPRLINSLVARRYSDGAPTIWGGRVAFGRVINRGTMAAVFIQRRPGSRQLLRLGRGTIPVCPQDARNCFRVAAPRSMDLGPTRLALVWALAGGNAFAQEAEELWIEGRDGSTGRLLDVGGAGECGFGGSYSFRLFGQPSVMQRRVSYLAYLGDCWLTDTTFTVTGPDPRTRRERASRSAGAPRTIAYDAVRDGTGWWSIRGPRPTVEADGDLSRPCEEGRCRLLHSDHLPLKPAKVSRTPRPPVMTGP